MIPLTMIAAQSLDGFIALPGEPGTGFASGADRKFLKEALRGFDSMIMGRKTFDTVREQLLSSRSERFLRKIVTRAPALHAKDERPERIEFTDAEPAAVLEELASRGRRRCALLGGGQIYTRYLAAGLVSELWLTVEPRLFGDGTPLVNSRIEAALALESVEALGEQAALLKYRVG